MVPRLDKDKLRKELIKLYEKYLLGEDILSEAKTYFKNYSGAQMFLDKTMNDAIGYLENIGWDLNSQEKIARDIFEDLQTEN